MLPANITSLNGSIKSMARNIPVYILEDKNVPGHENENVHAHFHVQETNTGTYSQCEGTFRQQYIQTSAAVLADLNRADFNH